MKKQVLRLLSLFTAIVLSVACLGSVAAYADMVEGGIIKTVEYDVNGYAVLTLTTEDSSHYITYTADESLPTADLPKVTGPVTFYSEVNIRAAEFDSDGQKVSGIKFTVAPKCLNPVIEGAKEPGSTTVTITTATPDASVYYTLDGSDPTAESSLYTEPITLTERTKIRAIVIKDGFRNSAVIGKTFSVLPPEKENTAEAEPASSAGSESSSDTSANAPDDDDDDDDDDKLSEEKFVQKGSKLLASVIYNDDGRVVVIINKINQSDTIRYTIDGKNPTKSSPEYTKAFSINKTRVVKAYEYTPSGGIIGSVRLLVQGKCAKVELTTKTIMNGLRLITMSCNTPGADIYFTVDGSSPSEGSSLKYDGTPVPVRDIDKISAIAYKDGYIKSGMSRDFAALLPFNLNDFKYNNSQNNQLLDLMNEYRSIKGLSELTLDKDLSTAAFYQTKFFFKESSYSALVNSSSIDQSLKGCGVRIPTLKKGCAFAFINSPKSLFNTLEKNSTMRAALSSGEYKRVGIAFDEAFGKKTWVVYLAS